MNKLSIFIMLLSLASCSSRSKNENGVRELPRAQETKTVSDAPIAKKEEARESKENPPAPTPVEPVRSSATPSQYSLLMEGVKEQSDEKIYQGATQILANSPNDMRALNALAMYHYKKGRFDLCRFLLNKAISSGPKTAELYSNLGVVQLAQGEKRDAIKSFRKALEINNYETVAASNLGAIYTQEKDFSKAQIVLEIAYSRGVRDSRVLNNYAITLHAQGKLQKSEELFKELLKENSSNKEYLFNYAILLIDGLGKYQDGLDVINRLKFVGGPADTRNRIIALENKAKAGLK